jgi:hypothetical protein
MQELYQGHCELRKKADQLKTGQLFLCNKWKEAGNHLYHAEITPALSVLADTQEKNMR